MTQQKRKSTSARAKTPAQLQREIDETLASSKVRTIERSHATKGRDEWKETWDWAANLWGPDPGYAFNAFFRAVASIRAEREGWEELGSSDVWHASYDTVKDARKRGVKTREELIDTVLDNQEIWGHEKDRLIDLYAGPQHASGERRGHSTVSSAKAKERRRR